MPERKRRRRLKAKGKTVSLHSAFGVNDKLLHVHTETAEQKVCPRHATERLDAQKREDLRPLHDIRHLSCTRPSVRRSILSDSAMDIHVV